MIWLRKLRAYRDTITLGANLTAEVCQAGGGDLLQTVRVHNKVPLVGRNLLRDLLGLTTPGTGLGFAPTHFALGTGTTATSDGDTFLVTEIFREVITARKPDASKLIFQFFLSASKPTSQPVTLAEAGLFDNPAAGLGLMFSRAVLSPAITKTSSVEVTFTWEITIGSSG